MPSWIAPALWLIGVTAVIALLWLLGPILTPFLVGALLAYLLDPAVEWLANRRCPRWLATLLMVFVAGLTMALLLLILVPIVQKEVVLLRERLPVLAVSLTQKLAPLLRDFGWEGPLDGGTVRQWISDQLAEYGGDIATKILASLRTGGGAIAAFVGNLLLVPIVCFYFLQDWPRFMGGLETALPRRWHAATMDVVREIDELLSLFFRGQLLVMLVLAGYYAIAMTIAGFELAAPIGILTGLLVFIPYVGYAIGLVLALLAALLQFGDAWGLIAVAIIYGAGQLIESFFLTPRLVGERIGLHPVAVIFALLAFGQLFGFFGVLAALPLSAALLVGIKRLLRAYLRSDWYRRED